MAELDTKVAPPEASAGTPAAVGERRSELGGRSDLGDVLLGRLGAEGVDPRAGVSALGRAGVGGVAAMMGLQRTIGNARVAQLGRVAAPAAAAGGGPLATAERGISGPTSPLPHRAALEAAFGVGLGHVQAHVGPEASEAASALGARAYALGEHVAFREPAPRIETVAHEVVHVLQGRPGASRRERDPFADPAGPAEREAHALAGAIGAGHRVRIPRATLPAQLICREDPAHRIVVTRDALEDLTDEELAEDRVGERRQISEGYWLSRAIDSAELARMWRDGIRVIIDANQNGDEFSDTDNEVPDEPESAVADDGEPIRVEDFPLDGTSPDLESSSPHVIYIARVLSARAGGHGTSFEAADADILSTVAQQVPDHSQILIHCTHGADRTGVVTAFLLVTHWGWAIPDAFYAVLVRGNTARDALAEILQVPLGLDARPTFDATIANAYAPPTGGGLKTSGGCQPLIRTTAEQILRVCPEARDRAPGTRLSAPQERRSEDEGSGEGGGPPESEQRLPFPTNEDIEANMASDFVVTDLPDTTQDDGAVVRRRDVRFDNQSYRFRDHQEHQSTRFLEAFGPASGESGRHQVVAQWIREHVTGSDRRILMAISVAEGGFGSLNTYDKARVSWGLIQFNRGSFVRVLQAARSADPVAFQNRFEQYGITVAGDDRSEEPAEAETQWPGDTSWSGELYVYDHGSHVWTAGTRAAEIIQQDPRYQVLLVRAGDEESVRAAQVEEALRSYVADILDMRITLHLSSGHVTLRIADVATTELLVFCIGDIAVHYGPGRAGPWLEGLLNGYQNEDNQHVDGYLQLRGGEPAALEDLQALERWVLDHPKVGVHYQRHGEDRYIWVEPRLANFTGDEGAADPSPVTYVPSAALRTAPIDRSHQSPGGERATPERAGEPQGEGWSSAGYWNSQARLVSTVWRIPLDALENGVERGPLSPYEATTESAEGRAIALVPERLDWSSPVQVLVHLHGPGAGWREHTAWQGEVGERVPEGTVRDLSIDLIPQQLESSSRNVLAILPQGDRTAYGFDYLSVDGLLAEVWHRLEACGAVPDGATWSGLLLSGQQVSGDVLARNLENGLLGAEDRVDAIYLYDGITSLNVDFWIAWIETRLEADLVQLRALDGDPTAQLAYIAGRTHLRAYYSLHHPRSPPAIDRLSSALSRWFYGSDDAERAHTLAGLSREVHFAFERLYVLAPSETSYEDHVVASGHPRYPATVSQGEPGVYLRQTGNLEWSLLLTPGARTLSQALEEQVPDLPTDPEPPREDQDTAPPEPDVLSFEEFLGAVAAAESYYTRLVALTGGDEAGGDQEAAYRSRLWTIAGLRALYGYDGGQWDWMLPDAPDVPAPTELAVPEVALLFYVDDRDRRQPKRVRLPSGELIEPGHVFAGIDAVLHPDAGWQMDLFGVEAVPGSTWAGDIGSALAACLMYVSYDSTECTPGDSLVEQYLNSYANPAELLADLDGDILGQAMVVSGLGDLFGFPIEGDSPSVHDLLQIYYAGVAPSDRSIPLPRSNRRFHEFVSVNGLELTSAGDLAPSAISFIREHVDSFAEAYFLGEMREKFGWDFLAMPSLVSFESVDAGPLHFTMAFVDFLNQGLASERAAEVPNVEIPTDGPEEVPPTDLASDVRAALQEFYTAYNDISVDVPGEAGELITVYVDPPYWLQGGSSGTDDTARRVSLVDVNRSQLSMYRIWQLDVVLGIAKPGRATRDELRQATQLAVDMGLVAPPSDPTEEAWELAIEAWMVRYGMGVDCSAFVQQALQHTTAALGLPSSHVPGLAKTLASSELSWIDDEGRTQHGRLEPVTSPRKLLPGDTMAHETHVRIVLEVHYEGTTTLLTTIESGSVRVDRHNPDPLFALEGFGPMLRTWRLAPLDSGATEVPDRFADCRLEPIEPAEEETHTWVYGRLPALARYYEARVGASPLQPSEPPGDAQEELPTAIVVDPEALRRSGPPDFTPTGDEIPEGTVLTLLEQSADGRGRALVHVSVAEPAQGSYTVGQDLGWTRMSNLQQVVDPSTPSTGEPEPEQPQSDRLPDSTGDHETGEVATPDLSNVGWHDHRRFEVPSPNATGSLVEGYWRLPLDDLEHANPTPSNTYDDNRSDDVPPERLPTEESAVGRAVVYVPVDASLLGWSQVDILLYLHGHQLGLRQTTEDRDSGLEAGEVADISLYPIAEHLGAAGRPLIAVCPQGTTYSNFFGGGSASTLVAEVMGRLQGIYGLPHPPIVGDVLVVGHSGAGPAARATVENDEGIRAESLVLFEAINTGGERDDAISEVEARIEDDIEFALSLRDQSGTGFDGDRFQQHLHDRPRLLYYCAGQRTSRSDVDNYRGRYSDLERAIGASIARAPEEAQLALEAQYRVVWVPDTNHTRIVGLSLGDAIGLSGAGRQHPEAPQEQPPESQHTPESPVTGESGSAGDLTTAMEAGAQFADPGWMFDSIGLGSSPRRRRTLTRVNSIPASDVLESEPHQTVPVTEHDPVEPPTPSSDLAQGQVTLRGSVGRGGNNAPDDVRAVQLRLFELGYLSRASYDLEGVAEGASDPIADSQLLETIAAIERLQASRGLADIATTDRGSAVAVIDGLIEPGHRTLAALNSILPSTEMDPVGALANGSLCRVQVGNLPVSSRIVDKVYAVVRQVRDRTGCDLSGAGGYGFAGLGREWGDGRIYCTWHKTGRAIDIPQELRWVRVREGDHERLYLPAAEGDPGDLQGSEIAAPMADSANRILTADERLVDITQILLDLGFSRIPSTEERPEWWHFQITPEGQSWWETMLDFYDREEMLRRFREDLRPDSVWRQHERGLRGQLIRAGVPESDLD